MSLDESLTDGVMISITGLGVNTVMCRLTMGIFSEECVVRRFRCRANVIECIYTNLGSVACYTPRLYGIAYSSLGYKPVQHVTVLNTVGNCNTVASIIILYYILYYIIL